MTQEPGMRTNVSGAINSDRTLSEAVGRATALLAEELGESSGLVHADWGLLTDDAGPKLVQLVLVDSLTNSPVIAKFAPDEFKNQNHLLGRLRRLWGDLLQIRSHHQLHELRSSGGPIGQ